MLSLKIHFFQLIWVSANSVLTYRTEWGIPGYYCWISG